jgi:hypothetical protein
MLLRVDTGEAVKFTAKLERDIPNALAGAVASALNSAAFDVKQKEMPAGFAAEFEKRQPNFAKANSRVEKVTGKDINSMRSIVGFKPLAGTNKAVDDLEQQEHGGSIGGRSFIPLSMARVGGSWLKLPKKENRISGIQGIVDSSQGTGVNDKEKFIRSVLHAGVGGYVIGNRVNRIGNKIMYKINSIQRKQGGYSHHGLSGKARQKAMSNDKMFAQANIGDTIVKMRPLFSVRKARKITPQATHFMEHASTISGEKIEKFYIKAAERALMKWGKPGRKFK